MRPTCVVLALFISAASLNGQGTTSPMQYVAPPSSIGCPVVFAADRLSNPGLRQAQQLQQGTLARQQTALQQQMAELRAKRSAASAQLSALPPGSDPAIALELRSKIKALDEELAGKTADLAELSMAAAQENFLRKPAKDIDQNIQITFKQTPSAITGVDLTIHGVSMSPRVTPAAQSRQSDLSETFHLSGTAAEPVLESAVGTHTPMIVTWVELSRIQYADGAVWQKSTTSHCAAAPSPLVLVGL